MKRLGISLFAVLMLFGVMAAPASASAILVGDTISFDLVVPSAGTTSDSRLIAGAGQGIVENDGSNIGGTFHSGPMLEGEFIKVFDTSIVFSLFGGADDIPAFPGYKTTGYEPDSKYVLSGLFDPAVAEIAGVSILLNNVVNVAIGPGNGVTFDQHSVTLLLADLGILATATNLGTVTLNLDVRDLTGTNPNPAPVPEPATLTLLGSGVAAAWIRRRRSGNRASQVC